MYMNVFTPLEIWLAELQMCMYACARNIHEKYCSACIYAYSKYRRNGEMETITCGCPKVVICDL